MKNIILIILFLNISCYSFGQNNTKFQTVNIPDSVLDSLVQFLSKKENVSIDGAILIYNLIDKKNYNYIDGIYSFKLLGPHFHSYIFIVNQKCIRIFKGYYINDLLPEFHLYLNQSNLSVKTKIQYLKAVSLFLEAEFISENT